MSKYIFASLLIGIMIIAISGFTIATNFSYNLTKEYCDIAIPLQEDLDNKGYDIDVVSNMDCYNVSKGITHYWFFRLSVITCIIIGAIILFLIKKEFESLLIIHNREYREVTE